MRRFGHVERIGNDRGAIRGIDSVSDWLRKRGLNVEQTRRMVYDRIEWREFGMRNAWGVA